MGITNKTTSGDYEYLQKYLQEQKAAKDNIKAMLEESLKSGFEGLEPNPEANNTDLVESDSVKGNFRKKKFFLHKNVPFFLKYGTLNSVRNYYITTFVGKSCRTSTFTAPNSSVNGGLKNMEQVQSNNNELLHTIQRVQREGEIDFEVKAGLGGSAFMTGYFALAFLAGIIENGLTQTLQGTDVGGYALSGLATLGFLGFLGIYIKEKIQTHKAVKIIREETGMTKERQREALEDMIIDGDTKAIELFDYFYGEKKRKAL